MTVKSVVVVDMVGYGIVSDMLEEGLASPRATRELNAQIQQLIDAGLEAIGATRAQAVFQKLGDGAILAVDRPSDVHTAAQAIHHASQEFGRARKHITGKRVLRIGVATGDVDVEERDDGGLDIAGAVIKRAKRLEEKAPRGGLLIDEATFKGLSVDQQSTYRDRETVGGKRDESFEAFRCVMNPDGEADTEVLVWRETLENCLRAEAFAADDEERNRIKSLRDEAHRQIARLEQGEPHAVAEGGLGRIESDVLELLESLLDRAAPAPDDLDEAFGRALRALDESARELDRATPRVPSVESIQRVLSTAIKHGAGIYNHKSPIGRIYCGRIYREAAGLVVGLPAVVDTTECDRCCEMLTGTDLAVSWLFAITSQVTEITDENGDEAAWELRFAFDAIIAMELFENLSLAIRDGLMQEQTADLLGMIVERAQSDWERHIAAYALRHTAETLVAHYERIQPDSTLAPQIRELKRTARQSERMTRDSIPALHRMLSLQLVGFSQSYRDA